MAERKIAYIFPGQGSQAVGMGRDLFQSSQAARLVFEEADDVLRMPVSSLCFQGPAEELVRTVNVQPAVFTVSIACLRAAQETGRLPLPVFVAGHSLGEYTALVAAGAMSFADGLRLVRERGRLMQEAGDRHPGGMLALLGVDMTMAEDICQQCGCYVANVNCPGQIVISGSLESIDKAREFARVHNVRALPLKVSGAFHSPLMAPALDGLRQALASVSFNDPKIPVVSNVTGSPILSVSAIKEELLTQLDHRVQWQKSVEYMVAAGVSVFLEIGPGNVLSGLVKRTVPAVAVCSLGDASTIANSLASLSER